MATNKTPEKAPLSSGSLELGKVAQPQSIQKLEGFQDILSAIESIGHVAEDMTEDTSARDAAGGGTAGGLPARTTAMTARDMAIANLPLPKVMQKELEKHIKEEVRKLRAQARTVARSHGPGAAYHLNGLYARIRQFNTLLGALLEASVDVVKRFFIRVFIDRQPIL